MQRNNLCNIQNTLYINLSHKKLKLVLFFFLHRFLKSDHHHFLFRFPRAVERMQMKIRVQGWDRRKTNRPPDCARCYEDIFQAGCRWHKDVANIGGGGWARKVRGESGGRTIQRFAALKFHDYVGSNFGWSRGRCSPARRVLVYLRFLETEGVDGSTRPKGGKGREG